MSDKNVDGFARDKNNYALLNVDAQGYIEYKKQREQSLKFRNLETEVSSLKQDLGDIKNLLITLINGKNNV